jgi:hypothetical protein
MRITAILAIGLIFITHSDLRAESIVWKDAPEKVQEAGRAISRMAGRTDWSELRTKLSDLGIRTKALDTGRFDGNTRSGVRLEVAFEDVSELVAVGHARVRKVFVEKGGDERGKEHGKVVILVVSGSKKREDDKDDEFPRIVHETILSHGDQVEWQHDLGPVIVLAFPLEEASSRKPNSFYLHVEWTK